MTRLVPTLNDAKGQLGTCASCFCMGLCDPLRVLWSTHTRHSNTNQNQSHSDYPLEKIAEPQ